MDKARETALKALNEIETKEAYSNLVLKKVLRDTNLDGRDKAFVTELVYGTVTWKLTLDWVISRFSKTRLNKLSVWVLLILRLGVYQLLFLDRVPPSAACNTAVDLAKKYAKASSGFINAILRNISRQKAQIDLQHPQAGSLSGELSLQYSFPEYLVTEWITEFGEAFTRQLLKALVERPDFSVRVNTLKATPQDVMNELTEAGIKADPGRFLPEALVLHGVTDISQLPVFNNGWLTVQDESSMLAARILDPQPGERVLDVCAAPGGKTTHIAQLMQDQGQITAWDIHEHKTDLIRENAQRLGIHIIDARKRDAMESINDEAELYHRVLVDAPCSGTGIIRRKPDIKWQRKQADFDSLVEVQRKILYNAGRAVALGGVLVYSTCSMDERENEQVVRSFLDAQAGFERTSLDDILPENLRSKHGTKDGMLKLYPHIDGTDGFFIARLKKKG
ncbi:MAG: 16S rRNA (cytosine(967)-C(5))-methyltransferase RsmB [Thermoclostridium sp.]|nr:16S rRNA (cytosine(967)-C(5))-methyltransferase RsmB [Thermoclostridium sp.]